MYKEWCASCAGQAWRNCYTLILNKLAKPRLRTATQKSITRHAPRGGKVKGMAVGKGANRPKDALANRAKLPHGCWAEAADERSVGGKTKNGLRLRQKRCEQCGGRDKRLNAGVATHRTLPGVHDSMG